MNVDLSKDFLDKLYDELKKNPISITLDDKIESIYKKLASLTGEGDTKNNKIKNEDNSDENNNSSSKLNDKIIINIY